MARRDTQCRQQEANDRQPGDSNTGPDDGFYLSNTHPFPWPHINHENMNLIVFLLIRRPVANTEPDEDFCLCVCARFFLFPHNDDGSINLIDFFIGLLSTLYRDRRRNFGLCNSLGGRDGERSLGVTTRHFPLYVTGIILLFLVVCIQSAWLVFPSSWFM